ncbi:MAG: GumC family protein [Bacteroidia bacterium]
MNLIVFSRIVLKNAKWLLIFPCLLAGMVIYFTRDLPKEFETQTTIYTGLASGYSITDDGTERIDNFKVNNAFDNLITTIKSRETVEEVAIKLLAQHLLLKEPDPNILGVKGFQKLKELVSDEERAKMIVPNNFNKTVQLLYSIKDSSTRNTVRDLLTFPGSYYFLGSISGSVTVTRKNSSDMLEMTLKSNDPGVCWNAMKFYIDAFSMRYRGIKGSETQNVVKYFEQQLQHAFSVLQSSENKLRDFGVNNKIINYYEQAKFVAESKEDLSTDYYKEKMKLEAAQKATQRIEEKMNNYSDFVGYNEELVTLRQELANINFKITNATLYKANAENIAELRDQAETIKIKLKEKARDYYEFNNSIEWVPQESLLNEWLSKIVELEESKGRLQVFEMRMKQYDGIYQEFAPLGSTLGRLEREISVNEKEYLSVLHGLNLAKLRQQSLEMSNNLKVIDNPYFPLQPLPSKRALLIIGSFIVGLVLLLAYYIAQELMNKSLRSPEKVESILGLPLLNALPEKQGINTKIVGIDEIASSMMQQVVNEVFIDLRQSNPYTKNYLITVFSVKSKEGKSFFAEELVKKLSRIRNKVLYLYPETSKVLDEQLTQNNPKVISQVYQVNDELIDYNGINDFMKENESGPDDDISYTILEIPELKKYPIPSQLISMSNLSILVVHAQKSWTNADRFQLKNYQKLCDGKIKVILNHVEPDLLESIYGEIPKKRSNFRRKLKLALGGQKY